MHKDVNLVDIVKSFRTNIYLQNLASIQKRTSPVKFAHLAEKSWKGSISNISTKVQLPAAAAAAPEEGPSASDDAPENAGTRASEPSAGAAAPLQGLDDALVPQPALPGAGCFGDRVHPCENAARSGQANSLVLIALIAK